MNIFFHVNKPLCFGRAKVVKSILKTSDYKNIFIFLD